MKAYQYIVSIKGRASESFKKIAQAAGISDKKIDKVTRSVNNFNKQTKKMTMGLPGLKKALIGVFAISTIFSIESQIRSTTIEMEKYRAVLDNTFQSATMGEASMQMITDFASKTPFQVNELTGSFVKLVNRGIVPSQEAMRQYGDVAASQGKSFDQFVEAVLDAGTGEFERLKEFGIKANSMGDQVAFTFKGQTKVIQKNEQAIATYLQSLGNVKGVKGSMEAISLTLGGMASNLMDKVSQALNGLGTQLKPLYTFLMEKLGVAIDYIARIDISRFVGQFVDFLKSLPERLRPVINAVKIFWTGLTTIYNVIEPLIPTILKVVGVMWLLNIAMTANPVGLIIAGITMLIGLLVHAWQKVEWFRGGLKALGATIKHFGVMIKDYIVDRFKGILTGLTGLGKALLKFFQGDWKGAWEAGKQGVLDLTGISAKKKLIESAKQTGEIWRENYEKGASEAKANKAKGSSFSLFKDKEKGSSLDYEQERANYLAGAGAAGGAPTGGSPAGKGGVSSITGGGSKQTNINIQIGKLNEKIEINTTNLKEGASQIESKITEVLLRVLNSANQLQTNS